MLTANIPVGRLADLPRSESDHSPGHRSAMTVSINVGDSAQPVSKRVLTPSSRFSIVESMEAWLTISQKVLTESLPETLQKWVFAAFRITYAYRCPM